MFECFRAEHLAPSEHSQVSQVIDTVKTIPRCSVSQHRAEAPRLVQDRNKPERFAVLSLLQLYLYSLRPLCIALDVVSNKSPMR